MGPALQWGEADCFFNPAPRSLLDGTSLNSIPLCSQFSHGSSTPQEKNILKTARKILHDPCYLAVLVRVSIDTIKHYEQKAKGEERVYLAFPSTSLFIIEGSWARTQTGNLDAGADAEACRVAAYWLAQTAFS